MKFERQQQLRERVKLGRRLSAADGLEMLDEIDRLNRLLIGFHAILAKVHAWCVPSPEFKIVGQPALDQAWEMLSRNEAIFERARELERLEGLVGSATLLVHGGDRLASEVERLIRTGKIGSRTRVGDALLDYDAPDNDGHRQVLGLAVREGAVR